MTAVKWLVPDTPSTVSHGRSLLADYLSQRGYEVTVEQASVSALRDDFDVLIGTTRKGGLLSAIASVSRPVIVDHVDPISQFYRTDPKWLATAVDAGERVAFRRADHTMYVYAREERRLASPATKTTLPVDVDLFDDPDRTCIGERLQQRGISPGFIVYTGGLEPRYHIETLCRVAEYSSREVVIAGDGSKAEYVKAASKSRPNLHYLGALPHSQMPDLLNHAGVGVQLVDDAHTVTALEYGLSGLPVIHLSGAAEKRLPDCVEFVDADAEAVAEACRAMNGAEMKPLEAFAHGHDVELVADDYERAIGGVL